MCYLLHRCLSDGNVQMHATARNGRLPWHEEHAGQRRWLFVFAS
ncbi:hypothetical protein [Hymenobacter sp. AT01-02]|nr:hypothetical protein [Hymenobacter sp. AT01-02]